MQSIESGFVEDRFGNQEEMEGNNNDKPSVKIQIPLNTGANLETDIKTVNGKELVTVEGGREQTIEFDFLRIDSWDGEEFQVFSGDETIFKKKFYFGKTEEKTSSSATINGLNYTYEIEPISPLSNTVFNGWDDQRYRVTITTPPELASIELGFGSTLNQSIEDESWGIDNLVTPITNFELELLNEENLLDINGYIELTDTIYEIEPTITLDLTPLATPVEVFTVNASSDTTGAALRPPS